MCVTGGFVFSRDFSYHIPNFLIGVLFLIFETQDLHDLRFEALIVLPALALNTVMSLKLWVFGDLLNLDRTDTLVNKVMFLNLYKSLVRPHLEYATMVWSPMLKKTVSHWKTYREGQHAWLTHSQVAPMRTDLKHWDFQPLNIDV